MNVEITTSQYCLSFDTFRNLKNPGGLDELFKA